MIRRKVYPLSSFKAIGADGTFEAIVSVFNNIDFAGDRVLLGAFANSLLKWKALDDPIPVIFSHQWSNLDAHVGQVLEVRELAPGDPLLPEAIKDLGGLYVKGQNDLEEPYAARLHKLMQQRRIKEFSFAYDILDEKRAKDGANDLIELELIEVGPTLKGMNAETQLIGAKDAAALLDELDEIRAMLVKKTTEKPNPDASERGTKAFVDIDGSFEALISDVQSSVRAWALERPDSRDIFYCGNEATFADRVIVYLEMWEDPYQGGSYYEATYTRNADGAIELGAINEVEIQATVVPKGLPARAFKEGRRNSTADLDNIQAIHDAAATLGAACGEAAAEEPAAADDEAKATPAVMRSQLDLELLESA